MKFKEKKNVRQRGTKTHGCGSMKKRRGAGNRGGRGRSGSGKRGDQKKPSYWKDKVIKGFSSKSRTQVQQINIKSVENLLGTLVKQGKANKTEKGFELDLGSIGYNKLLAAGKPNHKLIITVDSASKRAMDLIKTAGGSVLVNAPVTAADSKSPKQTKEPSKEPKPPEPVKNSKQKIKSPEK